MKLCKECQASKDKLDATVRKAVTEAGFVEIPEGITKGDFQRMILKAAYAMRPRIGVATRAVMHEGRPMIRVRRFDE